VPTKGFEELSLPLLLGTLLVTGNEGMAAKGVPGVVVSRVDPDPLYDTLKVCPPLTFPARETVQMDVPRPELIPLIVAPVNVQPAMLSAVVGLLK
jgi:hypothetical protein